MKKLIVAAAFVLIALISCGSETTLEDAHKSSARIFCEKVFTCDEGIALRPFIGGTEAKCREAVLAEMKEGEKEEPCKNFNSSKADDCISCTEKLTCAQTFPADDDGDEPCPVCDQVCD
jgi:hypothetical protein